MAERKACTFCGAEGHRASQCRHRKAAVLKAAAAEKLAVVRATPEALVHWLHQHPDTLTTGAALVASVSCLFLIASGA